MYTLEAVPNSYVFDPRVRSEEVGVMPVMLSLSYPSWIREGPSGKSTYGLQVYVDVGGFDIVHVNKSVKLIPSFENLKLPPVIYLYVLSKFLNLKYFTVLEEPKSHCK